MVFSAQLTSQNFGHLLSLACLQEWAWYNGVPFSIADLDDQNALAEARPDEPLIAGPGSLFYAPWVPAFERLEEICQRRRLGWYTGLVPEFLAPGPNRALAQRLLAEAGPFVVRWPAEAEWLREHCQFGDALIGADPALLAPYRAEVPSERARGGRV